MLRLKLIGLSLLVISLMSAVGAASAVADVAYWVVNGAELARGQTRTVVTQYGAGEVFKLVKNGQTIKITCNKATGEEELIGGRPGTDKYKNLAYFECSANTAETGCELVGGFNTEEFGAGKWLTRLVVQGANVLDVGEHIKYKFELKNCTVAANNGAHVINDPTTTIRATVTNRTGFIHIVYKEEAEEGFEIEGGGEVTYSAEGSIELEGGTVQFAEGTEEAPFWSIGGTRLVAGKTHNIDARVYKSNSFTLTNATDSVVITCKALGTEKAVLLGSSSENAGKDNEITVFSQCSLVSGNGAPECELANEAGTEPSTVIKTLPMRSEQVANVEGSKGGKQLLEEFRPVNPAQGFVDLVFRGTKCTVTETIVSGSTVAEVRLDTAAEGIVELGQTPKEATSLLLRFPATSITQVWLISSGVGKVQKTGQISFGSNSVQTGTALLLLANTKFEPEPAALWSALP